MALRYGIYISHTAGIFFPWKKFPPEGNRISRGQFSFPSEGFVSAASVKSSNLAAQLGSAGEVCKVARERQVPKADRVAARTKWEFWKGECSTGAVVRLAGSEVF